MEIAVTKVVSQDYKNGKNASVKRANKKILMCINVNITKLELKEDNL